MSVLCGYEGGEEGGRKERRTFVIDLAITINIRLANHLVDFVISQFLACQQRTHHRKSTNIKGNETR